jgi:endogenous inhibitor of DNA gyrase (YacG/DUF329 family)
MPFCSKRCRDVDLGKWLSEGHSIPIVGDEEGNVDLPRESPEE